MFFTGNTMQYYNFNNTLLRFKSLECFLQKYNFSITF